MAKGRKRKSGARHKNGRLKWTTSGPDRGTEEMQRMRADITKDQRLSPDYPLSILLGHGLLHRPPSYDASGKMIDPGEDPSKGAMRHDAGMRFAGLYWSLFGKPFGRAQDYQQAKGGSMDAAAELQTRADYETALTELRKINGVSIVQDLAVFLRRTWLIDELLAGKILYDRHRRRLKEINQALDVLSSLPQSKISHDQREIARQEVAA